MPPPLISDYKKRFVLRRILQTFLGGPRLFTPPFHIIIQCSIFTLPAILISLINLDPKDMDLKRKAIMTTCSVFLVDLCLSLVILLLKRGRTHQLMPSISITSTREALPGNGSEGGVNEDNEANEPRVSPERQYQPSQLLQESDFLNEEDVILDEGIFKPSTWEFIAPNVTINFGYILAIVFSSLSFGLCTPMMLSPTLSPVIRGFTIFAVCIARYSSVINSPPEIATFDEADRKHLFYRIFYTNFIGAVYILCFRISEDMSQDLLQPFSILLAICPLLWTIGILPPLNALFPWCLENILVLAGGSSPSCYYFGTIISLVIVLLCPIIVFVISQEPLIILMAECFCGYLTSCDTGRILNLKSTLCEEMPTKKCLTIMIAPSMIIITSLLSVLISSQLFGEEIGTANYYELGFAIAAMTITSLSWLLGHFCSTVCNEGFTKFVRFPLLTAGSLLKFLLHVWLTISIQSESNKWSSIRSSELHSLVRLVPYILSIRGFALAISQPGKTSLDLTVTFIWKSNFPNAEHQHSFVLILFIVSLITQRLKKFLKLMKTVCSISYAFGSSTILGSKLQVVVASVLMVPISGLTILFSAILDGSPLTPIFSLPIFVPGYVRPASFWSGRWFPPSKDKQRARVMAMETIDAKLYSEIGPMLASQLCRQSKSVKLRLETRDCFLARYEDRLLFIRVESAGWNFAYLSIQGLEMQEQTSCHHQEAAKVDECFGRVFGPCDKSFIQKCPNPLSPSILTPFVSLKVPTYSEAKANITNLYLPEDKSIFQDMFYRAFSYLWIKNNPALKGESYQRLFDRKEAATNVSKDFSINDALFKYTSSHINFISVGAAMATENPLQKDGREANSNVTAKALTSHREPTRSEVGPPADTNRLLSTIPIRTTPESLTMLDDSSISQQTDRLTPIWIKQCVGDIIPPNAIKIRVEKICRGLWDAIFGIESSQEIDLVEFFNDSFHCKLRSVSTAKKANLEEISLKAFRYATKLTLDEIFSGNGNNESPTKIQIVDAEAEEEIFEKLTLFERDYHFCSPPEIPFWISQNCNKIITIAKKIDNPDGITQGQGIMRILNYETEGVEFKVGRLDQSTVEAIWSNLNLELLYFTSDDDERFSIQNDRVLLRNIITQCAKAPLGYSVYDALFRVNIFDYSVTQLQN